MENLVNSSPLILVLVFLVIGFVFLMKGADFFVEGSSSIAKRLKVPPIIIAGSVPSAHHFWTWRRLHPPISATCLGGLAHLHVRAPDLRAAERLLPMPCSRLCTEPFSHRPNL